MQKVSELEKGFVTEQLRSQIHTLRWLLFSVDDGELSLGELCAKLKKVEENLQHVQGLCE